MIRFVSDLAGTILSYFRIGSHRLKSIPGSGEVLEVRDKADTEDRPILVREVVIRDPASGFVYRVTVPETSPAYLTGDLTLALPPDAGSSAQALLTDGAGNTYWGTVATGANATKTQTETITFNDVGLYPIFTPPQGALIESVKIVVDTSFDGSDPTCSVGVAADEQRYLTIVQAELASAANTIFEVAPLYVDNDATPANREVVVRFTHTSSPAPTQGSFRVIVTYSNPD